MKMKRRFLLTLGAVAVMTSLPACQPKTASEKMADNVEDAGHETGQAVERAGDRVKDAAD